MGEKKKPGRFTLQFNLEDPQQRTVSALLEQQGRRKAQFLTNAVLCYMQHPEVQEYSGSLPTVNKDTLEQMVLEIIKKNPQFVETIHDKTSEVNHISSQTVPSTSAWETPIADDAMAAISETLAAFQQGK